MEDLERLDAACHAWRQCNEIALDTEFERSRTYYPRVALIQVFDGESCYLVDPLAIEDLASLFEVLADPGVVKLMHSCGEDMEVFFRLAGAVPSPVYDTQVAAAFAGLDFGMGYARLVHKLLGLKLTKGETRSNWLKRPLSDAQTEYAAQDVVHLPAMRKMLQATVEQRGTADWLREDLELLLRTERFDVAPEQAYLRIKQAGRLTPRKLAVLRSLAAWREREARRRDRPRNFVVRDAVLVGLADDPPSSIESLKKHSDLHPNEAQRFGPAIVAAVQEALSLDDGDLPEPLDTSIDLRPYAESVNLMKTAVRDKAAELGLPPEVLSSGRVMEALVRARVRSGETTLQPVLSGWRHEVLSEPLLAILARISHQDGDGSR